MKGDLSNEDSQLIEKCANYSKDAYYKTVKGKFIEDLDTDTQSYLSLEGETIVFTGQGTTSFQDWKMDLQIFRTRVPYLNDHLVHCGYIKSYESIRNRVHEEIDNLRKNNFVSEFVCTGHSLFGAIATVAALDFKLKYNLPVKCVTFGSPRVGSGKFALKFNEIIDKSYRCVRLKDPVAFTPFGPRFKHVSGSLHFAKKLLNLKVPIYNPVGCRVGHHSIQEYLDFIIDVNCGNISRQIKQEEDKPTVEAKEGKPKPKKKRRWWFW